MPPMPLPAIQAEGLTKTYKDSDPPAVAGLEFTQPAGSTWALLGGNGAGKSTTIAMLLGLLCPVLGVWWYLAMTWRGTVSPLWRG